MPKVRLFNPRRHKDKYFLRGPGGRFLKKNRHHRRHTVKHKHRRNPTFPGGTLTYMANPHRRRHHKAHHTKHRRRHHNVIFGKARRRHNPHRSHRHHNPAIFGVNAGILARQTGWAILGGIATRSLPATVLGDKNTGLMGYGSNAATALVFGGLLTKLMGAEAGSAFVLGGTVMLAGRLVEDFLKKQLVQFMNVQLPLPTLGQDRLYNMSGDFARQEFPVPYASSGMERLLAPGTTAHATVVAGKGGAGLGFTPGLPSVPSGGGVWRGPWQN